MAEELDVSWFDLKKYDALAELNLGGWHTQLEVRKLIFDCIYEDVHADLRNYDVYEIFEQIKNNPIWRHKEADLEFDRMPSPEVKKYPFNTNSVSSTKSIDIWNYANTDKFKNVWDNCKSFSKLEDVCNCCIKSNSDLIEMINTPYDLLYSNDDFTTANVSIDLTATDEQILNDFQHWLTEYRKATGYHSNKNNFTNKDLTYWHELQLLPCIDLIIDAEIQGKKITQARTAELLNHNLDKFRTTIRTNVRQLLRYETIAAIEAQLSSFPKK